MAFLTVHQRIGKSAEMTGSYPCLRVHQDRTVNAYVVRALHDEFLPPCFFHVVFQFNTERAVIPGICQAAVNSEPGYTKPLDFATATILSIVFSIVSYSSILFVYLP